MLDLFRKPGEATLVSGPGCRTRNCGSAYTCCRYEYHHYYYYYYYYYHHHYDDSLLLLLLLLRPPTGPLLQLPPLPPLRCSRGLPFYLNRGTGGLHQHLPLASCGAGGGLVEQKNLGLASSFSKGRLGFRVV